MSEMLLVIPSGWTEITWEQVATTTLDRNSIVAIIGIGSFVDMTQALRDAGLVPEGKEVVAAQLIEAMENTIFVVRFE